MSEPNDNIISPVADGRRADDITGGRFGDDNASKGPEEEAPSAPKNRSEFYVLAATVSLILMVSVGLCICAIAYARMQLARMAHLDNCKQMCLAVNNIASNSSNGDIPPSYGRFPSDGPSQSFFVSLLPYIDQQALYANWAATPNTPVKTYIAAADPYNPGTNALISYGTNATLLGVNPPSPPRLPASFCGRTSSTIVVFERTARCGATWSSTNSYLIDDNGSTSPETGEPTAWANYGNQATALTSAGCTIGMGDGSARLVTQSNANAGWAWAMNPRDSATQSLGW